MLDFTSSLYLGFTHPSEGLRQWPALTSGIPAALGVPPLQHHVERGLARLTGAEQARLAPSTLHVFWDLFGNPLSEYESVLFDYGSYAIGRWGAARALARGSRVGDFSHHSPGALERKIRAVATRRRPVVVTDGFCINCGRPAPIADYLSIVAPKRGVLLVDDTQALGILGVGSPERAGGGGSLCALPSHRPNVLVIASLAKAFGVPAAFLAGDAEWIGRVSAEGDTAYHSSPPSACDIRATERALALNRACGERLRGRLRRVVAAFRRLLGELGLYPLGSNFPVQTLVGWDLRELRELHRRLLDRGIRTVLRRVECVSAFGLTFLLTVHHSLADVERAACLVARILIDQQRSFGEWRDVNRFKGSALA